MATIQRYRELIALRLGLDHNWSDETHTKSEIIAALDSAEDIMKDEDDWNRASEEVVRIVKENS